MSNFINLAQAKTYIRLSSSLGTDADAEVQQAADIAENIIENYMGISFSKKEFTEYFTGGFIFYLPLTLPLVEVIEIVDTSLNYTLDLGNDYFLKGHFIYYSMLGNSRWPRGVGRFKLKYEAGYESSLDVPKGLGLPVLLLTKRIYEADSELAPQALFDMELKDLIAPFMERILQ